MMELPLLGQVHMKPDIFETAYFLSGVLWTGLFNLSGQRFQDNAVSVSRLTGFVWTEGRFVKVCGSKNIRMCKRSL